MSEEKGKNNSGENSGRVTEFSITGIMDINNTFVRISYEDLIIQLVSFSEKARREGLLALEDDLDELPSVFMRKFMQLIVDGTDPVIVRYIAEEDAAALLKYHRLLLRAVSFYLRNHAKEDIEEMYGDYISSSGLRDYSDFLDGIRLQLQEGLHDYKNIPEGCDPVYRGMVKAALSADEYRDELIGNYCESVLEQSRTFFLISTTGILGIQSGDNPRLIREKLIAYVSPSLKNGFYDNPD